MKKQVTKKITLRSKNPSALTHKVHAKIQNGWTTVGIFKKGLFWYKIQMTKEVDIEISEYANSSSANKTLSIFGLSLIIIIGYIMFMILNFCN